MNKQTLGLRSLERVIDFLLNRAGRYQTISFGQHTRVFPIGAACPALACMAYVYRVAV